MLNTALAIAAIAILIAVWVLVVWQIVCYAQERRAVDIRQATLNRIMDAIHETEEDDGKGLVIVGDIPRPASTPPPPPPVVVAKQETSAPPTPVALPTLSDREAAKAKRDAKRAAKRAQWEAQSAQDAEAQAAGRASRVDRFAQRLALELEGVDA